MFKAIRKFFTKLFGSNHNNPDPELNTNAIITEHQNRNTMKSLYYLFVGINDYPEPVSKLGGCIKDLNNLEKFIDRSVGHRLNVMPMRLQDDQATYANVINGFRSHLRKAGPDDVVWFHFSGHGAEERTAEEFISLEPNGKDTVLVCYDSRTTGHHLADKEIAVLLHEVATTDDQGNPKPGSPHIVVSLDSCHSGSGTRAVEIKPRTTPSSDAQRDLASYIDGYYQKQWTGNGRLSVPFSDHVALSACASVQVAGDMSSGGVFSNGLVKALNSSSGNINYPDLHLRARTAVKKLIRTQTPQFEAIGSFDPYTRFLDGSPHGDPDIYDIFKDKDDGGWYVKCGAILGMPYNPDPNHPIIIEIRDTESEVLGTAEIELVGAQRSRIKIDSSFKRKALLDSALPGTDIYRGILKHMPIPPDEVFVDVNSEQMEALQPLFEESKYAMASDDPENTLKVLSKAGRLFMRDDDLQKTLFEERDIGASNIVKAANHITRWRRKRDLQNSNRSSGLAGRIELWFSVLDENGDVVKTKDGEEFHTGSELHFKMSDYQAYDGCKLDFQPHARFNRLDQKLFFYLYFINNDYSVLCPEGQKPYRPNETKDNPVNLALWTDHIEWGLDPHEETAEAWFKILVTTEPFDYEQLLQAQFSITRGGLGRPPKKKMSDDWWTVTTHIKVEK